MPLEKTKTIQILITKVVHSVPPGSTGTEPPRCPHASPPGEDFDRLREKSTHQQHGADNAGPAGEQGNECLRVIFTMGKARPWLPVHGQFNG